MRVSVPLFCAPFLSLGCLHADWSPVNYIENSVTTNNQALVFTCYDLSHNTLVATYGTQTTGAYASISPDHGNTWTSPVLITDATHPNNAVFPIYDPANQSLVATWVDADSTIPYSAISTNGGTSWSTNQISSDPSSNINISTAYDSADSKLITIWTTSLTSGESEYSTSSDGSTWGAATSIDNVGAGDTFLSYDPSNGTIAGAFGSSTNNNTQAFVSSNNGGTWDLRTISSEYPYSNVFLTYLPNGTLVASWSSDSDQIPKVALSTDGGNTWGSAITISNTNVNGNVVTAYNPSLDLLVATWTDNRSSAPYYSLSTDGGQTWKSPRAITSDQVTLDTSVSYDPVSGSFIATWVEYNGHINLPYYSLFSPISTFALSGNNLKLANYLIANAPLSIIRLLALLTNDELNLALQSMAPTRNAFLTFSAQTAQISLSRLLNDHFGQQRLRHHKIVPATTIASRIASDELVAQSDEITVHQKPSSAPRCLAKKPYSFWMGAFGEFAHDKPEHQTPVFNTGSGGAIAAFDYSDDNYNLFGSGITYAHTHIYEKEGAGHGNVDQGALFVYGAFSHANWYFDTALWGGYYHAKNVRNISFPGFSGQTDCKTHGWQFTPHLEVGYSHWINWLCIEPFAMADYVSCWEDHAHETGAYPLNFGQKGKYCSLLRGEGGVRFEQILTYCWGTVTFVEKGSYAYQKAFHTGRINAFLIGYPGSFTVTTLTTAQNMGVGELEILFAPAHTCYSEISFSYHTELGTRYQTHQAMAKIGWDF